MKTREWIKKAGVSLGLDKFVMLIRNVKSKDTIRLSETVRVYILKTQISLYLEVLDLKETSSFSSTVPSVYKLEILRG